MVMSFDPSPLTFDPSRFTAHLDILILLASGQQLAIDAEGADLTLLVADHAQTLAGQLRLQGALTACRTLQCPQEVPSYGVNEARTICGAG